MHNLAYALKRHLSTDAEAPSDLTATLWPSVGKPFGAVLSVLPGTETSPKSTHLQIRLYLSISLLCNILAATMPVIPIETWVKASTVQSGLYRQEQ